MNVRLKSYYKEEGVKKLNAEFNYKNTMQVPKLSKIVLNMGLGEALTNVKVLDEAQEVLATVTGQKPTITRSKKAIASFKLRKGMPIGCRVTLHGDRMYEFFDRLVNFTLPRIKDFKGLAPNGFDGSGNYTLGLKEQIIFPEINYEKIERVKGLNVTIVTTARNDKEGKALLSTLGMPFRA
jgi:large subunit ribosomal protein L5